MYIIFLFALASSLSSAAAQTAEITEVSDCHFHGDVQYCVVGDDEWEVTTTLEETDAPTSYSDCHAHGSDELHCTSGDVEVTLVATAENAEEHDHEETTEEHDHEETEEEITEVNECHLHDDVQYCMAGDAEYEVIDGPDAADAPDQYTDCHAHGDELHCTGDGLDVTLALATSSEEHHSTDDENREGNSESAASTTQEGVSCHFHAGVEHCVDAEGNTVEIGCSRPEYEYNVPLRIGLLFAVLTTSAVGVFAPIVVERFSRIKMDHIVFIGLRQFGTGIIISTAIIHLFTHAQIYFNNECLGRLEYEATTAAIVMAGIFVTFVVEYTAYRLISSRRSNTSTSPSRDGDSNKSADHEHSPTSSTPSVLDGKAMMLNTTVIEAGIIFHSILLGVVLVVANDTAFLTLYIVITFHQFFEGLALGTRIALVPCSFLRKSFLGLAFAITTPIGMAAGIGALASFNGNDPATLIAIGTLNALSAGILLWIGVTEMWFKEWWFGPLARGGVVRTVVGFVGLISGLALMSLLGKWA